MSKLLALLLIIAVSLAIAVVWSRQHQTQSMPMIQASACPRLENPCLKIDCRRPPKGIIA